MLIGILTASNLRSATKPSAAELLSHVQAADVLSDLLTWSADRAAARADSIRTYLKEIGKLDAVPQPTQSAQPTTAPAHALFYDQLFAGAVQFVSDGGDKYADAALRNLDANRQTQELTALQHYNIQEFLYLNQQRRAVAELKAYLRSIKSIDAYTAWAVKNSPDLAPVAGVAQSAAAATPEESVARIESLMASARAAALKRAEAKGVSEYEFDKQWTQKQDKLKEEMSRQADGMSALASAFAKTRTAPAIPNAHPSGSAGGPASAQTIWEESFGDPFTTTYQGPGEYGAFDTRVNIDNDQRVNGEYDRRANLEFDRRVNVQITPRKGV